MILLKRSVARLRFSFFYFTSSIISFFILTTIQQQKINYHKLTLSTIPYTIFINYLCSYSSLRMA